MRTRPEEGSGDRKGSAEDTHRQMEAGTCRLLRKVAKINRHPPHQAEGYFCNQCFALGNGVNLRYFRASKETNRHFSLKLIYLILTKPGLCVSLMAFFRFSDIFPVISCKPLDL